MELQLLLMKSEIKLQNCAESQNSGGSSLSMVLESQWRVPPDHSDATGSVFHSHPGGFLRPGEAPSWPPLAPGTPPPGAWAPSWPTVGLRLWQPIFKRQTQLHDHNVVKWFPTTPWITNNIQGLKCGKTVVTWVLRLKLRVSTKKKNSRFPRLYFLGKNFNWKTTEAFSVKIAYKRSNWH